MNKRKPSLAIFDFDGTITKRDTFLPFLFHTFGRVKTILGLLYNSPFILAFYLKIITNQYAKAKIIEYFFKNIDTYFINQHSKKFINTKIDSLMRTNILKRLLWHQNEKHTTILISASLELYVKPWAKKMNFNYIEATKLNFSGNKLTGTINGKNCYGKEKLSRLNKIFGDNLKNYNIYGYGDGEGDRFFLEICNHKYYKKDIKSLR